MSTKTKAPDCCLCDRKCEPWPTHGAAPKGYGHNPDPFCTDDENARCCDNCNHNVVIPSRLAALLGKHGAR